MRVLKIACIENCTFADRLQRVPLIVEVAQNKFVGFILNAVSNTFDDNDTAADLKNIFADNFFNAGFSGQGVTVRNNEAFQRIVIFSKFSIFNFSNDGVFFSIRSKKSA